MKNILRNAFKAGAAFFLIGVALTLAAPAMASLAGVTLAAGSTALSPIWNGLYFAGFGAMAQVLAPVFDAVFSGDEKTPARGKQESQAANVNVMQDIDVAIHNPKLYTQMIDAQRTQAGQSVERQ